MSKNVFEVLEEVAKKRNKADKVKVLKDNESWALKDILRGTMDSTIQWNLPGGAPPYTPSDAHNHPASLLREHKKFKFFVKGLRVSTELSPLKRETMFIGLIEGVHPKDAELIIAMVNKEKPVALSRPIVEEAFPGLLQD